MATSVARGTRARFQRHLPLSVPAPRTSGSTPSWCSCDRQARLVPPADPRAAPRSPADGTGLQRSRATCCPASRRTGRPSPHKTSRFRRPAPRTSPSTSGPPDRHFIQPAASAACTGSDRSNRLSTPTRVLAGADDPNIRPDILRDFDDHADDPKLDHGRRRLALCRRRQARRGVRTCARALARRSRRPSTSSTARCAHSALASCLRQHQRSQSCHEPRRLLTWPQAITESDGAGRETGERTRTVPPICTPPPVRRRFAGAAPEW